MKRKVLIWGNGKSAYTVANYIKANFADCMDFIGFYVADYQHIYETSNEPIYKQSQIISEKCDVAEVLVIPNPGKKIADILYEHRNVVDKKVLFVSAENIRHPKKEDYFLELDITKPWLNGFEYHVADHCNLNCKGCGHCANLFNKPSYGNLHIYECDLIRMTELFDGVGLIRLLGGEPLLNNDLEKYIGITRKYFKNAEVHIVTNGILILSKGNEFFQCLKDNGIIIDISVYPPIRNKLLMITRKLDDNDIEYNVMPVEQFYKRFSLAGGFNEEEAFNNCGTATCHTLCDGKIAPCIVPFSMDKLNQEFDINISVDGWIDLFEDGITGDKINVKLKQPFGLCSHCDPEKCFFDWEQRNYADCKLEDWICD